MSAIRPLVRRSFERACAWPAAWKIAWLLFAVMFALYGCGRAQAQNAPSAHGSSVARGEHFARMVCSACHVVAKNQEFPPLLEPPAPSFAEIANRPGMTAKTIRHFVMSTHWDMTTIPMKMPDLMLLPEDASAVSSYIMSLKSR
jgi:mono/diheme cytochrome c family protein